MKHLLRALIVVGFCPFFLGGCSRPDHEKAIRERVQALSTALCQGDVEACVEFADPVFVRAQGRSNVKGRFGILFFFLKVGKVAESDLRIDNITVESDRKKATVKMSYQSQGEWKSLSPMHWVISEGKWYMTF